MAVYTVDSKFWDDEKVIQCSPLGRLILLVCITGPQRSGIPGLQHATIDTLSQVLRYPYDWVRPEVEWICHTFPTLLQIDPEMRIIRMPNGPRYCPHGGSKNIISWHSQWRHFPNSPLKYEHIPSLLEKVNANFAAQLLAWNETFGQELSCKYYIGQRHSGNGGSGGTSSGRPDENGKSHDNGQLELPANDSAHLPDKVSRAKAGARPQRDQSKEIRVEIGDQRDQSRTDGDRVGTAVQVSQSVPHPYVGTRLSAEGYIAEFANLIGTTAESVGASSDQVHRALEAMVRKCPGKKSPGEWERVVSSYLSTQVFIDNRVSSPGIDRRNRPGDLASNSKWAARIIRNKKIGERR